MTTETISCDSCKKYLIIEMTHKQWMCAKKRERCCAKGAELRGWIRGKTTTLCGACNADQKET